MNEAVETEQAYAITKKQSTKAERMQQLRNKHTGVNKIDPCPEHIRGKSTHTWGECSILTGIAYVFKPKSSK